MSNESGAGRDRRGAEYELLSSGDGAAFVLRFKNRSIKPPIFKAMMQFAFGRITKRLRCNIRLGKPIKRLRSYGTKAAIAGSQNKMGVDDGYTV